MKMNKTQFSSTKFDEIQFSMNDPNSVNSDFHTDNYFINYIDDSMTNVEEKSFEKKYVTGHVEIERTFLEILDLSEEVKRKICFKLINARENKTQVEFRFSLITKFNENSNAFFMNSIRTLRSFIHMKTVVVL